MNNSAAASALHTLRHTNHSMHKIAIFRALYLGDLLMTVPAFRALRRRFPQAEITLIGLPWAETFLRHLEGIDRFVAFGGYAGIQEVAYDPQRSANFIAAQRAYGYDLVLQMHGDGNITNGLVAALAPHTTLGFARPGDTRLSVSLPHRLDRNEVLRWLQLIAVLGAPTDDTRIAIALEQRDEALAAALLRPTATRRGPLIGMHVGAKEAIRRWPPERFAALADALTAQYGAQIALTGTPGEQPLAAAVEQAMQTAPLNLVGRTDIGAFAALLTRLDLLVTNDTGASHLAAATRTPSVVLFGPTRPEHFAPLDGERHRVVDALALAGWSADPTAALQQLPVAPVLAACTAQLQRRETRQQPAVAGRYRARFTLPGS